MAYQVVDWPKYQSYKDRRPPWLRLHKSLLDNYEFQMMSADARALLPMLWLLASEDENPRSGIIKGSDDQIAFRLRSTPEVIHNTCLEIISHGFITSYISVTDSLQTTPVFVTSETETEAEAEAETDGCNGFEYEQFVRKIYDQLHFSDWNHLVKPPNQMGWIRGLLKSYGPDKVTATITDIIQFYKARGVPVPNQFNGRVKVFEWCKRPKMESQDDARRKAIETWEPTE